MDNPVRNIRIRDEYYDFPFGSTPMKNLVEGFCFADAPRKLEILMLGCGDVRHMLYTASVLSEDVSTTVNFTLNDWNPLVIARDVLLVKIICSADFDPSKENDMKFLWDLWYNMTWNKQTITRFVQFTRAFLENNFESLLSLNDETAAYVKKIWMFWIEFFSTGNNEPKMTKAYKERRRVVTQNLVVPSLCDMDYEVAQVLLSKKHADVLGPSKDLLPSKERYYKMLEQEILNFYRTGNTGPIDVKTECLNPTFLQPFTSLWRVVWTMTPFHSYCPLPVEELNSKVTNIGSLCRNLLAEKIHGFRSMAQENRLQVCFSLDNAVDFCMKSSESYDIIDTSTLSDVMGLVNIFLITSPLMTESSVLLTETHELNTNITSAAEYIHDVVGFGPNMFPAIFGLRLQRNFAFGNEEPVNGNGRLFLKFRWTKVPLNNPKPLLSLRASPVIAECLLKLQSRSFLPNGTEDGQGTEFYTSMTLAYVIRSMTSRFQFDLKKVLMEMGSTVPQFSLAWRAATAWVTGEKMLQYKMTCKPSPHMLMDMFLRELDYIPRLLLSDKMLSCILGMEHLVGLRSSLYMDNVDIEIVKRNGDIDSVTYSFLLPPGCAEVLGNKSVVLYDITTGSPLVLGCSFDGPFEITDRKGLPVMQKTQLDTSANRITRFVEDEFSYRITVDFPGVSSSSELIISAAETSRCETVHDFTVTWPGSCSVPLQMTVGHHFLVKGLHVEAGEGSCIVKLQKANSEMWPMDSKVWLKDLMKYPNAMTLWQSQQDKDRLEKHLELQYTLTQKRAIQSGVCRFNTGPGVELRQVIQRIFMETHHGNVLFTISTTASASLPVQADMIIRSQKYIRCYGPLKIPFLAILALERSPGTSLIDSKNVTAMCNMEGGNWGKGKKASFTELRICGSSFELFRCLVHRNSHYIFPDEIQEKLRLNINTWITSYLTPLYVDNVGRENVSPPLPGFHSYDASSPCCAQCEKFTQDMKRCSRCRRVFYCNRDCQRRHWPEHRKQCN